MPATEQHADVEEFIRYHLDRDRGFLTAQDKEYLLGELEYENDNNRYKRRARIRNHLQDAILDFQLFYSARGLDLAKHVFKELSDSHNKEWDVDGDPELSEALITLHGIITYSLYTEEQAIDAFGYHVSRGVKRMFQNMASLDDAYWDIGCELYFEDHGQQPVETLKDRYEEGTLLSLDALLYLYRKGIISGEDIDDYRESLSPEERWKMGYVDSTPWVSALAHREDIEENLDSMD